jgi:3-hydroxybutyryl-CoA dehydrogenase
MEIKTVGVLGCGLMGSGIAQVCAAAGYKTIVREVDDIALDKGIGRIKRFLDEGVAKGKVAAATRDTTLAGLSGTTTFEGLKDCDLIIEAIIENLDDKRQTYASLEKIVGPHTIFVSNTSSLCITELAAATERPDRFGGLHFFNPVPLMKLVEVIRALTTSDETYRRCSRSRVARQGTDHRARSPGFIVNRLLVPYLLDAIRAYENGLGTIEDIDKGMKLGCGYPMGPFTLLDFVGLDTTYYIANIMFEEFREPAYAPPPLLEADGAGRQAGQEVGAGVLQLRMRRFVVRRRTSLVERFGQCLFRRAASECRCLCLYSWSSGAHCSLSGRRSLSGARHAPPAFRSSSISTSPGRNARSCCSRRTSTTRAGALSALGCCRRTAAARGSTSGRDAIGRAVHEAGSSFNTVSSSSLTGPR